MVLPVVRAAYPAAERRRGRSDLVEVDRVVEDLAQVGLLGPVRPRRVAEAESPTKPPAMAPPMAPPMPSDRPRGPSSPPRIAPDRAEGAAEHRPPDARPEQRAVQHGPPGWMRPPGRQRRRRVAGPTAERAASRPPLLRAVRWVDPHGPPGSGRCAPSCFTWSSSCASSSRPAACPARNGRARRRCPCRRCRPARRAPARRRRPRASVWMRTAEKSAPRQASTVPAAPAPAASPDARVRRRRRAGGGPGGRRAVSPGPRDGMPRRARRAHALSPSATVRIRPRASSSYIASPRRRRTTMPAPAGPGSVHICDGRALLQSLSAPASVGGATLRAQPHRPGSRP